MKLELPFPDMEKLHAHAKGFSFHKKANATKNARVMAKFICLDAIARKEAKQIAGPVLICYVFFVKDNGKRDAANMIQACKPYVDGIIDAGICEGDSWQEMRIYNVDVEIDKQNPRVEISIHSTLGCGDLLAK